MIIIIIVLIITHVRAGNWSCLFLFFILKNDQIGSDWTFRLIHYKDAIFFIFIGVAILNILKIKYIITKISCIL